MTVPVWLAAVAVAAAIAAPAAAQKKGGHAVFAQIAPPPTLDMHISTSISTRNVAMHIYETLLTRGENNQVVKELAEDYAESPYGLTYTFKIRRGVKFHNGKEMTSADVLASYERYRKLAIAKVTLAAVESMAAPDRDTFVVKLKNRVPVFIDEISAFAVPITVHPAEEAAKEGGKIEPIGTGPYRFVEWVADSHIRLRRFDEYKPDERYPGTEGFGGRKIAWFDAVDFKLVKEPGSRTAGIEAGQFHVIEDLPPESAKRLEGNRSIRIVDLKNFWLHAAWVNLARAPTDKLEVRRAVQIALDMEEIMEIASDGAYALQPGLQYPGNPYYTDAGKEFYNVKDKNKARELLRQAGYRGEEFVIITNSSYSNMYKAAQVVAEQLKDVGFKVRMDVFDWATALAKRRERENWNLWFTGQGTGPSVGPFTALRDVVSPQLNQFVADPVLDKLYNDMITGATFEARKAAFASFQHRVYEQVVFLKFGDLTLKQAIRANVKGYEPYRIPRLWNVWIDG